MGSRTKKTGVLLPTCSIETENSGRLALVDAANGLADALDTPVIPILEHTGDKTYHVPVAFLGIELDCKATWIPCSIGASSFAAHSGKSNKYWSSLSHLGK